ncbi:DNA-3-methyladenine glycosylase 2 family protein [Glaciibacter flavus]|uniref:DNA-3-methyladenine glycosylase II n=1 Tax=Orlajensenia flava TaxID=2565934 RepID=A0A4S4G0C8_9MICO|nr:AlkA N-terminal domain-containing protein [Glaciibacter flavus]THG35536.1 DNA-3-methyladenine glycosylase 2 family protein [Glaciibacter flavus]
MTTAPATDSQFEERYRAMSSRDARFDGQFITGVHSTGIYCRPSCPATTPKRANVSFYLTAAAAHEAGLRACKRCLPDAVPGSPQWNIRDDLSAHAMRLIADGVVERAGVPGLAARLGYTPRHLTRVLQGELGAGPLALARAHRAQTARMLLIGTSMPMVDVAFAAGFGSVRQFNDTIASVYELTPTEVRARASARSGASSVGPAPVSEGTSISLRLPARAPFDGAGVLAFLGTRALPGVESWDGVTYTRAVRLPSGSAVIALRVDDASPTPAIACDASLTSLADLMPLVSRVRRLVDLDADAEVIDAVLRADDALADSVTRVPGIRVPGSVDPQETVFRTLVGQQVSVASARTALSRLTAAIGEPAVDAHTGWTLFPTPAQIADRGAEVLRGPASRIATILDVAERLDAGSLRVDVGMSTEELTAELTAVPGIGPWTAGYLAMRVLGSPDVLLTSDVAIRSGAARLGLPGEARALRARGAVWAPWRSYAGMHLWRATA